MDLGGYWTGPTGLLMGQSGTLVRQESVYNRDLRTWACLASFRWPAEISESKREWGRGVKEKNLNRNKTNTSSGVGVSKNSEDNMNEDNPVGITSAVQEGVTPSVVDMTIEKDKQSSLEDTNVLGSFPPLSVLVITTAGNAPGKSSYANVTGKLSEKKLNFSTLFTPWGNGIDVVVSVDSIRAISEQFAYTSYGFFLGKPVAYPIVANYVRNTWGKYGLIRSMFNSSTGLFSFQFNSIEGLDVMLENGSWSSYARAMIELRADVELKDNIMVAMPKITREGHYTCNIRVEHVWNPPRCASCKIFGHMHDECPKNTGVGETMNLKNPSQTSRGVPVGPKVDFKPHKEYRHVPKKSTASSSSNKKKGVEPTIEVSNSNPFEVLNSVNNDEELGTNGGTTNMVNNMATLSV
ncbi:hypothetical protein Tco_0241392 [Tanacetum coccineum]